MADGIKEREEFHFNMEALPSDPKEPLKIDIEKTPMRKIINNTSKFDGELAESLTFFYDLGVAPTLKALANLKFGVLKKVLHEKGLGGQDEAKMYMEEKSAGALPMV